MCPGFHFLADRLHGTLQQTFGCLHRSFGREGEGKASRSFHNHLAFIGIHLARGVVRLDTHLLSSREISAHRGRADTGFADGIAQLLLGNPKRPRPMVELMLLVDVDARPVLGAAVGQIVGHFLSP
jgi:hypothetical protein